MYLSISLSSCIFLLGTFCRKFGGAVYLTLTEGFPYVTVTTLTLLIEGEKGDRRRTEKQRGREWGERRERKEKKIKRRQIKRERRKRK